MDYAAPAFVPPEKVGTGLASFLLPDFELKSSDGRCVR
jgi:hypothetical protein